MGDFSSSYVLSDIYEELEGHRAKPVKYCLQVAADLDHHSLVIELMNTITVNMIN